MVEEEDDDYNIPNISRVDETSFTVPDTTEATSTLRKVNEKVKTKSKRDKINALYRHLNVTGNPNLIVLDRFRLTKDPKKRNHDF